MFRTILHHPIVAAILLVLLLIVLRFLYAIRGALWRQASVVAWAVVLMVFVMVVCLQFRVPTAILWHRVSRRRTT